MTEAIVGRVVISQNDAQGVMSALRQGVVPAYGLNAFAVGQDREIGVLREQLDLVAAGHSAFKAIRGGYGTGKTFLTARLAEEALERGFVVSHVALNRSSPALHQLERVYQSVMQNLRVRGTQGGAFMHLLERWLDDAEEYVATVQRVPEHLEVAFREAVKQHIGTLLGEVARERPSFSAALQAYHEAHVRRNTALKRTIAGWLMGDQHAAPRVAGLRGRVERQDAVAYLKEFTRMLRGVNRAGLVIILDELDEMRFLRRDVRMQAWSTLRDLVDQLGAGVPGLYLVLAGTPDIFDGPRGLKELPPLAQRLDEPTVRSPFPNLRGPQLPLPPFTETHLEQVMTRLRHVWETASGETSRLPSNVEGFLARGWTERLGERSPRIAIREFISLLDRARDHPNFDPSSEYDFAVSSDELPAPTVTSTVDPDDEF